MMRRILLAGTAAIALAAPAQAQVGGLCMTATGPCASLPQQLLDYARQFEQLQQEIMTAEQEVINTIKLPGTVYRDLTSDVAQITGIVNQANMLAGKSLTMINNLSIGSGYPIDTPGWNFHQQLTDEGNAVSLAMKTAAQAIAQQNTQLQNDAATLSQLQTQALSSNGRQQSLQTVAGLTAQMAQVMQKQTAIMVAASQGNITALTARADEESMMNHLSDRDLEVGWITACKMEAAAGGTSNACAGAGVGE